MVLKQKKIKPGLNLMSIFQHFNSKLSYKLHVPVILIIIFGLGIITLNASLSIKEITLEKHLEVTKTYQNYIQESLDTQLQIALTNSISIANNTKIQNSLFQGNSADTQNVVNKILDKYQSYTDYHDVKIHIHTIDLHSFFRSWKPEKNGDDLSDFRHTLSKLKHTHTPFASIETGRAGFLLRGLSPINYQNKEIGSIEFILSFNNIINEIKENHHLDSLIFSLKDNTIDYFNTPTPLGKQHALLSSISQVNKQLLDVLTDEDLLRLTHDNYIIKSGFFITGITLYNFNQKPVGYYLIADRLTNVNNIIDNTQNAMTSLIMIVLLIGFFIILILSFFLYHSITKPIKELSTQIKKIDSTNDLEKTLQLPALKTNREDEIGDIAKSFNNFIKHTNHLFNNLQNSNKINSEYLKAVNAGSIVSKTTPSGIITYVNQALCDITGYKPEELIGQTHHMFRHPSTPKSTFRDLWNTINEGKIWQGLLKNKRKDNSNFYVNITIVPIINEYGTIIEHLALRSDVSELVQSQKKLRKAFNTDSLTSLGSRFKLLDDYAKLETAYLAIIDIHSFKEINDFYGYKIGDQVICALANYLFNYFEEEAYTVYRLQGDSFATLVNPSLSRNQNLIEKLKTLSKNLEKNPLSIGDYTPIIDLTIGVSLHGEDLFTEADLALQTAKQNNQAILVYSFELRTSDEYQNNLLWTSRIKKALNENRMVCFYQPIVNNRTMEIEKYESLIRMVSEEGNNEIISPDAFLEIAKKSRLYYRITKIVIHHSFEFFANRSEHFSINLSAEDIANDDIISYLLVMLDRYNIGNRLIIEIVESESIQNYEEVAYFIQRSKNKGCKIAVDDFGTGYSNFEFILKLKPDFLKIDGSIVKCIHENPDAYNVVESIVSFAKKNNIKTIAEFVTEAAVFNIVKKLGIDYTQGYYFGEPQPGKNIEDSETTNQIE